MIQALAVLITTASIAGLGVIIEGAVGIRHWLRSKTSSLTPLTEGERGVRDGDPEPTTDEEE